MTATERPAGRRTLGDRARDHLWLHFAQHGGYADAEIPVIVRGEGPYVYDEHGKRYFDGL